MGKHEMARTRLSWLAVILLVGCAAPTSPEGETPLPPLEGMASAHSDDAYWKDRKDACYVIVDDIAQKKCLDKVADDQRRGRKAK
jgi:hypothetical protein